MKAPQIILIVFYAAGALLQAANYKEPGGKSKFWIGAIALSIQISLLAWGGFWG